MIDHKIAYISADGRVLSERRHDSAPCYGSLWSIGDNYIVNGFTCVHDIRDDAFYGSNFSPFDHLVFCEKVMEPNMTPTLNGVSSTKLGMHSYHEKRSRFEFVCNEKMNGSSVMALLQITRTPIMHVNYSRIAKALPYAQMLVTIEREFLSIMPPREAAVNAAHTILYGASICGTSFASDSFALAERKPLTILYSVEKYLKYLKYSGGRSIQRAFSYEPSYNKGACLVINVPNKKFAGKKIDESKTVITPDDLEEVKSHIYRVVDIILNSYQKSNGSLLFL
jgi:hypothetical protein